MESAKRNYSKFDLPPVPYFFRKSYLQGDFEAGTLRTEHGGRIIVLPEELIQGLHKAIEYETGKAWNLVAYSCGKHWSEKFLRNMQAEWRAYYSQTFEKCDFTIFESWVAEYFKFQGWGKLTIDFSMEDNGLVQFYIENSIFDRLLGDMNDSYVNEIFAGFIAGLSSWLASRDLECLEVESPQNGAARSRLVVGIPERVESARRVRVSGGTTEDMIAALMERQH